MEINMLLTIAAVLFVLWILGLLVHIGGALIHVILVIAVIVAVVHFLQRRTKA
jgi:hypothetical protein